MSGSVIGIDIGGTNIRVGLVDENLHLIRKATALTSNFQNADELFRHIKKMTEKVNETKGASKIGLALPIPWHKETECIFDATNIPCLEGLTIKEIESYFPEYEVYFENDVNVVAILESDHGASKEFKESMYITISTGIGSGIIYNKEIVHGAHGYAGEIGSMIISDSKKNHSTLYDGTLESLCSGYALEMESKHLYDVDGTTQLLFEKYQQGDKKALEVINVWVEHFSSAIASLIQTLDPSVFVVGGAVIYNNQWLIEKVIESAKQKVLENLKDKVKIVLSVFGLDAGVIGAGYLALKNSKENDDHEKNEGVVNWSR
ncbi:ROK family protein [Neobacillus drentensis]|uniref:ROK family protein n=1 Tax=Neobacillus drentensis TaxID=220684 RepID=UPI0030013AA3